eukprot:CAMPEP_0171317450 /NCGR_PEP_ID=MMETSP0816-20121228/80718_1 /TAXON_ID=420281 /ORGANISM="Proboscia inermis, Strain CCAP1064/1" /LENGTH=128 /DNA_ID=CAMNT_0011810715 /DNA_START=16 /DNA_END=402 /DNA_ORIENTATION=+
MRKSNPTNLRFRRENVIDLGLEMPDRTTQEYDGSGAVSNVSEILEMHWNFDKTNAGDGDHIPFPRDFPKNPYHRFGDEEDDGKEERTTSRGKHKKKSKHRSKGKLKDGRERKKERQSQLKKEEDDLLR